MESGTREHAEWAVKHLTVPQRTYLAALRSHWSEQYLSPNAIAAEVGVARHRVDDYVKRFQALGLLFDDGTQWLLHPDLQAGLPILGPTKRLRR